MKRFLSSLVYSFYIFSILLYIFSAPPFICICALACSALHECSHMITAKALGRKTSVLCFSPTGLYPSAGAGDMLSSVLIYAAGPSLNILLCMLSACAVQLWDISYIISFFSVNAALAVFNLLPIPFSDGDGIFRCVLGRILKKGHAHGICSAVEAIFSGALFFFFSYRFFAAPGGFFSFFLSVVFMLVSLSRLFGE